MIYQTPTDRVEAEDERHRAAWRRLWPGVALFLVGFILSFVGAGLASRALQVVAFAVGAAGVLLCIAAAIRIWWVTLRGIGRGE